jgi:hypothetical protein
MALARKVGIVASITEPDLSGPNFTFATPVGSDKSRFDADARAAAKTYGKPKFERGSRPASYGTPRFDGNPRPEGRERPSFNARNGRPSSPAGAARPAAAGAGRPGTTAKPSGPARGKVKRNRGF